MLKCAECQAEGTSGKSCSAYACPALDIVRQQNEVSRVMQHAAAENLATAEVCANMQNKGLFDIISSRRISTEYLLPLYCSRQQIEQVLM